MNRRAMTLVEVLVASAMLGLVLLGFFLILHPLVNQAPWMDRKHTNLQGFAQLRDYLYRRLDDALVAQVIPTQLAFYLPDRVDTGDGAIDRINAYEMPAWDTERVYAVELRQVGPDDVITEAYTDKAGREHTRALWNLGPKGSLQFEWVSDSILKVNVEGRLDPDRPATWHRDFTVHLAL